MTNPGNPGRRTSSMIITEARARLKARRMLETDRGDDRGFAVERPGRYDIRAFLLRGEDMQPGDR